MLWTKFSYIYGPLQLLLLLIIVRGDTMMEPGEVTGKKQEFSNKLYKAVSEEHSKDGQQVNLIFSPLSLEIVLSAAGLGARGNTQQEISSAIGAPMELEPMKRRYAPILPGLTDDDSFTLRVETSMFVQKNYSLLQNFVNGSMEVFMCGVREVDYVTNPAQALSTINGWVEEKTEGLIKDLLTMDAISVDTRLVLANAVYFKGKWAYPFDKAMTRKDKFNVGGGLQVDVDMMFIEKRFRYGYNPDLNAQILELPYEGNKLSMVILLPSEDSSLSELESKVSTPDFDLAQLLANNTHSQEVNVHLPKFKLELTTNLENVLAKLGMNIMFTDAADFSGITSSPEGLKVSKVVQKAFIEVSEEGTEAAAATGVFMRKCRSVPQIPENFKADRPFIYCIRETQLNTILFIGSLVKSDQQKTVAKEEL